MLDRRLEPEVMDTSDDAHDYDTMDHSTVNRVFVDDFLAFASANRFDGRLADQRQPLRVLDVGTGTALIPIELCSRRVACQIIAIDLAEEMLKLADLNIAKSNWASSIQTQRIDAKQMPYPTGAFGAVISNSIVHHIPEPHAVFAEMARVLQPGEAVNFCRTGLQARSNPAEIQHGRARRPVLRRKFHSLGGLLFVRDLLRPESLANVDQFVATYAGQENAHSQQLFRDSLHAALTLDEVRDLAVAHGIPATSVAQTSDRHWTLSWLSD